jgi:hypothetical protein
MKILKLLEARRNPSLNPKIDTLTRLKQLKANMATIDGKLTNGFVSFTDYNKIGVRPSNSYFSPTGIYQQTSADILELRNEVSKLRSAEKGIGNDPI